MSSLVRYLLIGAFALFVIGGIIAIVQVNRHGDKKTTTQTSHTSTLTTSTVTTPAPASVPTPAAAPAPAPTPATQPAAKKAVVTHRIISTTFDNSDEASASASAGTNPDGSTYAFADAN